MPISGCLLRLALAAVLLGAAGTTPAAVRAWLSQEAVAAGEPVTLSLEAEGSADARPDLSILEADFQILDRRSQRSVSIRNGRRSERLGLTLVLLPRRGGTLSVPPIPFGEEETPALTLRVTGEVPASSIPTPAPALAPAPGPLWGAAPVGPQAATSASADAPAVLLETQIDPPGVRVREQALLTVRVLAQGPVYGTGLRDPELSGARVLPLGEDRYPLARDDGDWQVYERRYAIFAEEPGSLSIGPLQFEGMIGGGPGFAEATSQSVTLRVRPIPVAVDRARWLPARRVTVTETGPEAYRVRPGQTLERVITLTADGVPADDLPRLGLNVPFQLQRQDTEPRLWDRREPSGVIGTRIDRILITPRDAGVYRLPEERLAWWNTGTERQETAVLPAREIEVAALATPEDRGTLGTGSVQSDRSAGTDAPAAMEPTADAGDDGIDPWFWVSLALAAALVLTLAATRRSPRRAPLHGHRQPNPQHDQPLEAPGDDGPADPVEQAAEDVRAAYASGNSTAAREALLAWAALVMPESPPSNLARLAQRCPEPLRGEILTLEQAFFSPHPVHWEQHPTWTRLRGFEPLPPEEPPTLRRAKPLRRRQIPGRDTS